MTLLDNYCGLGDIVRPKCGAERNKAALIFETQTYDYCALDRNASIIANALARRGVETGARIAVLSQNNAAVVILLLACAKLGAIFVPLNWRLSAGEVAWIVDDAEPAVLLVEAGLEHLNVGHTALTTFTFSDTMGIDWGGVLKGLGDDTEPDRHVGLEDVAMLVYTSGTTGRPKGAMLTHGNFRKHCGLDGPHIPDWMGISRDEICLVALPLFHVGGIEMLLRPLFTGATVVLHRSFDVGAILRDIARHNVTMTGLVPTALQMLLEHPESRTSDLSSLRKFLYGAAPIPAPLLKEALTRLSCGFVGTYGMTEANSVCVMLSPEDHRDLSASRLASTGKPTFGAEIRIVDTENRDCDVGATGEILVRGVGVMKGYWRNPDATAETIDTDGWLRSGDAGYRDADGFIYICDRVKDMICSGGENIYPAEVESAVFGHPDVAEVAVVGLPDDRWGESVLAVVVPRVGATIDPAGVLAWARERIASYKAPRAVRVVDALPKSAAGKILRREVRAAALAESKA